MALKEMLWNSQFYIGEQKVKEGNKNSYYERKAHYHVYTGGTVQITNDQLIRNTTIENMIFQYYFSNAGRYIQKKSLESMCIINCDESHSINLRFAVCTLCKSRRLAHKQARRTEQIGLNDEMKLNKKIILNVKGNKMQATVIKKWAHRKQLLCKSKQESFKTRN